MKFYHIYKAISRHGLGRAFNNIFSFSTRGISKNYVILIFMENIYTRSLPILGEDSLKKLINASVCIIGLGGVGSFAAESVARCGIGHITLIDFDVVSQSNRNRQLYALTSTQDKYKTEVAKMRIKDINPSCDIEAFNMFLDINNIESLNLDRYDYVIDAIDNVSAKVRIAKICGDKSVPHISVLGTGNKLKPEMLQITDIYSTKICPLARAVRSLAKKEGIKKMKVIYSEEEPIVKNRVPASMIFVPSTAGILAAREALVHIINM